MFQKAKIIQESKILIMKPYFENRIEQKINLPFLISSFYWELRKLLALSYGVNGLLLDHPYK